MFYHMASMQRTFPAHAEKVVVVVVMLGLLVLARCGVLAGVACVWSCLSVFFGGFLGVATCDIVTFHPFAPFSEGFAPAVLMAGIVSPFFQPILKSSFNFLALPH